MNERCAQARAEATELIMLGRPLPGELAGHVWTCPSCARDVFEAREVASTLAYAEGAAPPSCPPEVGRRIGSRIRSASGRRRVRNLAVTAAVAAAVALGIVLVPGGDGGPVQHVSLARDGNMRSHPWGTEVPVTLDGLRDGETYRLMTVGPSGRTVQAGSVHAVGSGPLRTHMVTAMDRTLIATLVVRDDSGAEVAQLPVAAAR